MVTTVRLELTGGPEAVAAQEGGFEATLDGIEAEQVGR